MFLQRLRCNILKPPTRNILLKLGIPSIISLRFEPLHQLEHLLLRQSFDRFFDFSKSFHDEEITTSEETFKPCDLNKEVNLPMPSAILTLLGIINQKEHPEMLIIDLKMDND